MKAANLGMRSVSVFGEAMLVPADTIVLPEGFVAAAVSFDGKRSAGRLYYGVRLTHANMRHVESRVREAEFQLSDVPPCVSWSEALKIEAVREQVVAVQQALAQLYSLMLESYLKKNVISEAECLAFLRGKRIAILGSSR